LTSLNVEEKHDVNVIGHYDVPMVGTKSEHYDVVVNVDQTCHHDVTESDKDKEHYDACKTQHESLEFCMGKNNNDVSVKTSSVVVSCDKTCSTVQELNCAVDLDKVINVESCSEPGSQVVDSTSAEMESQGTESQNGVDDDSVSEVIRKVPKYEGVYISGTVQGVEATFTVDTGANCTQISRNLFEKIPVCDRPRLWQKRRSLKNADGCPLKHYGRAVFKITLGNVEFEKVLTVSNVEDEVLLGDDILRRDPYGPADILQSKSELHFRGMVIPLINVGKVHCIRKAYAADHFVIDGMCEAIIDVLVDRDEDAPSYEDSRVLIEAAPSFTEKHSVLVAPTLCDISKDVTARVRLINPYDEPVSIRQDTVVGIVQVVDRETELMSEENPDERDNFGSVRRIALGTSGECVETIRREVPGMVVDEGKSTGPSVVPAHLTDLYDRTAKGLNESEKTKLAKLLVDFKDSFSKNEYDLGLTHLAEHVIDTGDAAPIKLPPRRVPQAFTGEDEKALDKLIKQGSVRPSTSPWSSPIQLVRKKDGSVRPCVDYRRLNAVTKKDAYPLPKIQECIDSVAGATTFSTLDVTSAYHQIPVKKEDIPKTAFTTSKRGLWEFTTMPFGMSNSGATFERVIELALRGLTYSCCILYLDDIIVYGRSVDEHLGNLRLVLERIKASGMKLKPSKCQLLQEKVAFLGHVISKEGVLPNPDNIEKVLNWPIPQTVTEVRSFLGLVSYYRRFVKDHSKIVHPLVQLTKKDEIFKWTDECNEAFVTLKKVLTGPDVMAHPIDGEMYIIDTDACDVSIGAVISQVQDGVERAIAYGSRTLSKTEKNYCVTDRELLAVVYFIRYYRHYLLGRHFVLRTDHQALKWLFSLKEPKNRIARWIEILSAYDFEIQYRPGKNHGNADAMSRCPNPQECKCTDDCEQNLKCGPCKKCTKRSDDMQSTTEMIRTSRSVNNETRTVFQMVYAYIWYMCLWVLLVVTLGCYGDNDLYDAEKEIHSEPQNRQRNCPDDGRTRPKVNTVVKEKQSVGIIRRIAISAKESTQYLYEEVTRLSRGSSNERPAKVSTPGFQTVSPVTMRKRQLADPDIGPVMGWFHAGKKPYGPEVCAASLGSRHYWNCWDSLVMKDNVLYRKFCKKNGTGEYLQLLVPSPMKNEVMYQMHNVTMSGHLGKKKTREKVLQHFYWYGVREDVDNWVRRCDTCGSIKPPQKTPRAPLGKMPVGAPLDRLSTDVLGPLPVSKSNNRYILVVSDHFTKWVEVFAIPDYTASTCAKVILNEVISRWGCPYDILSDQGANFQSQIFTELCQMLEIRKNRTSVANPRCNGQTERYNRTLLKMIKAYLRGHDDSWDENLGCLAAAYRATVHESTGMTPNLLMLGREVRLPAEVMYGGRCASGESVTSYGEYVETLKSRMQHAHEVARKHLKLSTERHKELYDANVKMYKYKVGDMVWYSTAKSQLHIAPKLRVTYDGPFLVTKKISDLDYVIQLNKHGETKLVHHNKLKPYEGTQKLKWAKHVLSKMKSK